MGRYRKNTDTDKRRKMLMFFLAGFVLGILYILLLGRAESSNMLMSRYFFSKYQYMDYSSFELMLYILRARFSVLIFLWLAGMTMLGSTVVWLFSCWGGFSFGLILTMAVLKFHLGGILLCVVSMFPQYLIYVPVMAFTLEKICEASGKKRPDRLYFLACFLSFISVLAGIFMESYVNPVFLKIIVKKM